MGRGISILALCAAAFAAAPAAATPSRTTGKRIAWLFNNGSFRKVRGEWIQQVSGRRTVFREVPRSAHFLTLADPRSKVRYRLYERTAYRWSATTGKWAYWQPGRWDDPRKRPLNLDRLAADRACLTTPTERRAFPLLGTEFEVLGPASRTYNCIAWSVGLKDVWLTPAPTLAGMDRTYRRFGYRRMNGLDYSLVPGRHKIVLYAKRKANGDWAPTHGARQLPDGSWSSKLGSLPLIRHLDPDDLDGKGYGVPVVVYVSSSEGARD
jgi:hypothetical protein